MEFIIALSVSSGVKKNMSYIAFIHEFMSYMFFLYIYFIIIIIIMDIRWQCTICVKVV